MSDEIEMDFDLAERMAHLGHALYEVDSADLRRWVAIGDQEVRKARQLWGDDSPIVGALQRSRTIAVMLAAVREALDEYERELERGAIEITSHVLEELARRIRDDVRSSDDEGGST